MGSARPLASIVERETDPVTGSSVALAWSFMSGAMECTWAWCSPLVTTEGVWGTVGDEEREVKGAEVTALTLAVVVLLVVGASADGPEMEERG